jgi:putative SOS response-associated peptidase YedK
MCYDLSLTTTIQRVADCFLELKQDIVTEFDPSALMHVEGNAFSPYPIVYRGQDDWQLHMNVMEWGIIQYNAKRDLEWKLKEEGADQKLVYKEFAQKLAAVRVSMLNCRSDRIWGNRNSYWFKIRDRRCLIPVDGIFEHRAIEGWKNKVPYYVSMRQEGTFFLPGMYSVVDFPDLNTGITKKYATFSLITRPANDLMQKINNFGPNKGRMPLFLPFDRAMRWLDKTLPEKRYKEILDYEIPSEDLDYVPVYSIRGGWKRKDGLPPYTPYEWPGLPPLGQMSPLKSYKASEEDMPGADEGKKSLSKPPAPTIRFSGRIRP